MAEQTGRPNAWNDLRQAQRTAVVDAILDTVARGDHPVIADIASQAGMSRVTFYKYFPTLGAAMLYTHSSALAHMQDYVSTRLPTSEIPAVDRFLASLDLVFEYTRAHTSTLRFFTFFDFSFRRYGLTAAEQERLSDIVADSGDRTRELFIEGQRDGSINHELPVDPTIMAISGSVLGLAQRLLIQDEYPADDESARHAHRLHLDACRRLLAP